jgi:hypothetical protein
MNLLYVSLVIILQSDKNVIVSKNSAPISTKDLTEYIAIKLKSSFYTNSIGGPSIYSIKFRGQLKITNTISIWATSKDPFANFDNPLNVEAEGKDKSRFIDQIEIPEDFDIIDGDKHPVKIEYDKDTLKIFIDQYTQEPLLVTSLSIADIISLNNGSCYIGITQETYLTNNILEFFNWPLTSSNQNFSKDSWSGLSLEYKAHWPIHLFLSPKVIEQYKKLFRFLFPLRRVKIDLKNEW